MEFASQFFVPTGGKRQERGEGSDAPLRILPLVLTHGAGAVLRITGRNPRYEMSRTEEGIDGWIRNSRPLRKPVQDEEPPEIDELNEHCDVCQMPQWACECELKGIQQHD